MKELKCELITQKAMFAIKILVTLSEMPENFFQKLPDLCLVFNALLIIVTHYVYNANFDVRLDYPVQTEQEERSALSNFNQIIPRTEC